MTPTGPGTIRIDRRSGSSENVVWVHLDNFDIDGVTLKTEHRNALTRWFSHNMVESGGLIIPVDRIWVFLRGYASRTGDTGHNLQLSRERVSNVRSFLNAYVSDSHITGLEHVGEAWSHREIEEDEQFRSVEVIMRPENRPPGGSPPGFIYDRFRMRAKLGDAGDAAAVGSALADLPGGLGATVLHIQIQNRTTHAIQNYVFVSAQATAGLAVPISASEDEYGDWVNFRTRSRHHVALSEFEGDASFGSMVSVQIGTYSPGESLGMGQSYFVFQSDHLRSVDNYVTVLPRTIVLPMPENLGLGFSLISMSAFGRLVVWH
jgi:hypothetical protein